MSRTWVIPRQEKSHPDEIFHRLVSKYPEPTLQNACHLLSSKAKRAMYAAAEKMAIRRGTWDGCAYNAAGKVEGVVIDSSLSASLHFDMPGPAVGRFITVWDNEMGSDAEATQKLRGCLLKAGLFVDPYKTSQDRPTTFSRVLHKRQVDEFTSLVESLDFDSAPVNNVEEELFNDVEQILALTTC